MAPDAVPPASEILESTTTGDATARRVRDGDADGDADGAIAADKEEYEDGKAVGTGSSLPVDADPSRWRTGIFVVRSLCAERNRESKGRDRATEQEGHVLIPQRPATVRSRRGAKRRTADRDEAEKDSPVEVSQKSDPAMEKGHNRVKERKLQAHNSIDREHDRDESKKDEAVKYAPEEDRSHGEVNGRSKEAEITQYLKFKKLIFCVNPCV